MEELNRYIEKKQKEGKTVADIAKDFDISEQYLYMLKRRVRTPSLKLANFMQEISKGAVPIQSWDPQ